MGVHATNGNLVWFKVRKDGGPDGRGVGFYFRNVTELLLFGIKGNMRTLDPGRRTTNIVVSRKQEHSRKPADIYSIIKACSPGPYLELFAREHIPGWTCWGDEVETYVETRRVPSVYCQCQWLERFSLRQDYSAEGSRNVYCRHKSVLILPH